MRGHPGTSCLIVFNKGKAIDHFCCKCAGVWWSKTAGLVTAEEVGGSKCRAVLSYREMVWRHLAKGLSLLKLLCVSEGHLKDVFGESFLFVCSNHQSSCKHRFAVNLQT